MILSSVWLDTRKVNRIEVIRQQARVKIATIYLIVSWLTCEISKQIIEANWDQVKDGYYYQVPKQKR